MGMPAGRHPMSSALRDADARAPISSPPITLIATVVQEFCSSNVHGIINLPYVCLHLIRPHESSLVQLGTGRLISYSESLTDVVVPQTGFYPHIGCLPDQDPDIINIEADGPIRYHLDPLYIYK